MPDKFSKKERITSRREIEILIKSGKAIVHYPIRSVFLQTAEKSNEGAEENVAILVSVPKRNFKKAVDRNLLKRRIRESYRLNKSILRNEDNTMGKRKILILFSYIGKEIKDFGEIETQICNILEKIRENLRESNQHSADSSR
ncbi:MAG: ribonuclease P protein component [Bacteroidales bacterium]|jgi:ribonuclease P protein component|nr:ribonuclease P protein component [Bacteroidales bacterium]